MCWKWSRAANREDVGEWGEKGWDCWRHGVPSPAVCLYSLSRRPRVRSTCNENTRVVSKSRTDRFQACLSCVVVKIGESPDKAAAADTLGGRVKSLAVLCCCLTDAGNFKVECFLSSSSGHVYDLMSAINRATLNVKNDVFHIVSSCVMTTPWSAQHSQMHCIVFFFTWRKKVPGSTTHSSLKPKLKVYWQKKGDGDNNQGDLMDPSLPVGLGEVRGRMGRCPPLGLGAALSKSSLTPKLKVN